MERRTVSQARISASLQDESVLIALPCSAEGNQAAGADLGPLGGRAGPAVVAGEIARESDREAAMPARARTARIGERQQGHTTARCCW